MPRHLSRDELEAGLPGILASPPDRGRLQRIVVRPAPARRQEVERVRISLAGGVEGDHWAGGCWKELADGRPDPAVQICIMNSRCIALIAQDPGNWAPAGDNLFVDLDLGPENLPAGQALAIGSAVLRITSVPHLGCAGFIARYGKDACAFVNSRTGRAHRLRGVYAQVVRDGTIRLGDTVRKLPAGG